MRRFPKRGRDTPLCFPFPLYFPSYFPFIPFFLPTKSLSPRALVGLRRVLLRFGLPPPRPEAAPVFLQKQTAETAAAIALVGVRFEAWAGFYFDELGEGPNGRGVVAELEEAKALARWQANLVQPNHTYRKKKKY